MAVWRLLPVDLADPNWEASSHRGPAVVRALDEESAREIAEAAFGVRSRFSPGKGMRLPPWKRPDLVRAIVAEHSIYPADGPHEVLEPSFHHDLVSRPPVKGLKMEERRLRTSRRPR